MSVGGAFTAGGSSSHASSAETALIMGGTRSVTLDMGGTVSTAGASTCPESVPITGTKCSSNLICAYMAADKGCCQETASARCKNGQWGVAMNVCECPSFGGSGSSGGNAAAGGSTASGGGVSSGGVSAMGGSTGALPPNGCRGEPIGYVAQSCDLLVPTVPSLMKLAEVTTRTANPLGLARASDDSHCVSVVTTKSGSFNDTPKLLGLSFEPWSNWPKNGTLGPMLEVPLSKPSGIFTLGPSDDRRIALAWQDQALNVMFGWDLDVDTFNGTYESLNDMHAPSAIGTSGIGHLVSALGVSYQATQIWNGDGAASEQFYGGCADTAVNMGIEPYGQGFLWAASTGSNNVNDVCSYSTTAAPGHATRIAIGQIAESCCSHTLWNFEIGDTVAVMKTAPHPEGLWVVWQTDTSGSRRIYWMRIGLDPTLVLGPGAASGPDDVPGDFAVAALGNKLAVAWGNDLSQPHLSLSLIDEKGRVTRNDPALEVPELHNLSMISGPAGAGLLIGFSDGNLMRLDCAEWE